MTDRQMKAEIGKLKNRLDTQENLTRELFRRVEMLTEDVRTLTTAIVKQANEVKQ